MIPPRISLSAPMSPMGRAQALTAALNTGDESAWQDAFAPLRKIIRAPAGMASLEDFLKERLEDALDYGHEWAIQDLLGCLKADAIAAGFLYMVRRGNLARMAQLLPLLNREALDDPLPLAIRQGHQEALVFLWDQPGLLEQTPHNHLAWLDGAISKNNAEALGFLLDRIETTPWQQNALLTRIAGTDDSALLATLVARIDLEQIVHTILTNAQHSPDTNILDRLGAHLSRRMRTACLDQLGSEALPQLHARAVAEARQAALVVQRAPTLSRPRPRS